MEDNTTNEPQKQPTAPPIEEPQVVEKKRFKFQIPKPINNFYILFAIAFLIWMFFIDGNDFTNQYKLHQKRKELQEEKTFYLENIQKLKEERKDIENDPEKLERLAREKYRFKKPKEDVYIVK
ncbi:MAG: septum formation initiator family protein [Bernardetiaceae bacterium]|nr:septum formation initiator family protein [Bernardetiaceae bacterium]